MKKKKEDSRGWTIGLKGCWSVNADMTWVNFLGKENEDWSVGRYGDLIGDEYSWRKSHSYE